MTSEPLRVQLTISAWGETTTDEDIAVYGSAVKFMAIWLMKQDGAMGKDTEALLNEFKHNVCTAMRVGVQGTG